MTIKFYYAPMTSATRIHWALEELGVPYEKVKLDLAKNEQKSAEYLALNPNGKVPLVVDDGTPIFESLAILIHLGEKYGVEKGLYPAASQARAEALKWMVWCTASLFEPVGRLLRNTSERFPADERNPKAAEGAKKEIAEMLGILDRQLAGRDYLVGDAFSLVDLSIVAFLPFLMRIGVDLNPYANINAWSGRCMQRPALGRAMMG
jgi:glutathione S-transferase